MLCRRRLMQQLLVASKKVYKKPSMIGRLVTSTTSAVVPLCLASTFIYQEATLPEIPEKPIDMPAEEQFSNQFLIRQSSIQSAEAASRLLTFVVTTVDDCVQSSLNAINELANLYEMGAHFQLTEAGEAKIVELRRIVAQKKKEIYDLELLFVYVKKLMDSNAEVTFLIGDEFCSKQASERVHSASKYVEEKLNSVKLAELDLTMAHKNHIEQIAKRMKASEEEDGETPEDENEAEIKEE